MIADTLEALDSFARIIGWLAMAGVLIWVANKILEERRATREWQNDKNAQNQFEEYLRQEDAERYQRYLDVRRRNRDDHVLKGDELAHWHWIAKEAGVPISEIMKDRR